MRSFTKENSEMKKLFLSGLFSSIVFSVNAGNDNYLVGARSAGIAHASVTLNDIWAIHHNQAGLAFLDHPSASVYYENRFLVKEMGLSSVAFAMPTESGTFGIVYHNFGYSQYAETKFGLAYGRKLSEKFSVGIQLNYNTLRLGDIYGKNQTLTAEAGVRVKLTDELTFGAHVYNVSRARLADYNNEFIPTIMRLGADYKISKKVFIAAEAQKDIDHKIIFKSGLEYHVIEAVYLRAGISTNPVLNTFGFGLNLKNIQLDVAASYHQVLGFSPQVSLTYNFSKQSKPIPDA